MSRTGENHNVCIAEPHDITILLCMFVYQVTYYNYSPVYVCVYTRVTCYNYYFVYVCISVAFLVEYFAKAVIYLACCLLCPTAEGFFTTCTQVLAVFHPCSRRLDIGFTIPAQEEGSIRLVHFIKI